MKLPVLLCVIYLEKGNHATFPIEYAHRVGSLETKLSFTGIRLWEYRDRILSGEWPELAPLLVLMEALPTEDTLYREVELIHRSGFSVDVQADLLGVALLVASRSFGRAMLTTIFGREYAMLDEMENLKEFFLEAGSFKKWLKDPRIGAELRAMVIEEGIEKGRAEGIERGRAEGIERGREEGIEKGRSEGIAEGKTETMREVTLSFLTRRFGKLPDDLVERIQRADATWCQQLFDEAITANTLAELLLLL